MKKTALLFAALLVLSASTMFAKEYKFKVHNGSSSKITKLLASEDGKEYGNFDIGSGIAKGATVQMVWAESTNSGSCEQYFKAVFADGSESAAQKFDFCEEDLTLDFSD